MANVIIDTLAKLVEFNRDCIGRGMHAHSTAYLNLLTQYAFRHAVRLPAAAAPTFVDVGCGSGEALLQALRMGFTRPVVGIEWDKGLLQHDTMPRLRAAGFESRRDFVLVTANARDPAFVTACQDYLRGAGYPSSFDVVYCQQVMFNTPPPLRPRVIASCAALGKAGGTLHLSVGPRYPAQALPPGQLAQLDPNPSTLSPTGAVFAAVDDASAVEDTAQGPRPAQRLTAAITVAPADQWVEAEAQARAALTAARLDGSSATMLRLGTGREFGLAAATSSAPSPQDNRAQMRPYGFSPAQTGYADWSAHWTRIALRRRECNQHGQTPANRVWNLVDQAEEMAVDVASGAVQAGMLSGMGIMGGSLAASPGYTVRVAPVEVMASVRL